jgi:uncharacterized protein (TIGR02996 family)
VNDGDALLATIVASPDEDTPRLVYADWLDENADAMAPCPQCDRGDTQGSPKLWMSSCGACGGSGGVPAYPAARSRAAFIRLNAPPMEFEPFLEGWAIRRGQIALLDSWISSARCVLREVADPKPRSVTISRGFVEAVSCVADWWLAHGDGIRAAHPVTRVRLTTMPDFEGESALGWRVAGDPQGKRFAPTDVTAKAAKVAPEERFTRLIVSGLLALRWPGVEFELPDHRRGIIGGPMNLLEDHTAGDMEAMRAAGYAAAVAAEQAFLDRLFGPQS